LDNPVLSIKGLTKKYGSITAVDNLTLDIEKGVVFGILGPNGSGKTTTLGTVLGVTHPTAGNFSWFGKTPTKEDRKRIGSILEMPVFYPYLTGYRNLALIARIKGADEGTIDEKLDAVGLLERKNSPYRTYSYGMKQRLAIASALLGDPEVMILDEPTNGLDPKGIAEIRQLITRIAQTGMTIIMASHILDEVQKICTHVAVLEKGKKLFAGSVDEVLNQASTLEISSDDMAALKIALGNSPLIASFSEDWDKYILKVNENVTATDINRWMHEHGIVLRHLNIRKKTLENYFLELLDKS
jgi:ABC-2 type transport system ATP-binding protein